MFARSSRNLIFYGLLFLAVMIALDLKWQPRVIESDALNYTAMGYNWAKFGVFSSDINADSTPEPSFKREPGYGVFAALTTFYVLPGALEKSFTCYHSLENPCYEYIRALERWQNVLIALTALLSAMVVFHFTGHYGWATLPAVLYVANIYLWDITVPGMTEPLAILLTLAASIFYYQAFQKKSITYGLIAGITLSMLALTKAVFGYFVYPGALILLIGVLLYKHYRQAILVTVAFIIGFSALTGLWMHRNETMFGSQALAQRDTSTLLIRVQYNKMSWDEYWTAYLYWTPFVKNLVVQYVDEKNWKNLDRKNPQGYLQQVEKIMKQSYGYIEDRAEREKARQQFKQELIKSFVQDWPKHMATTLAFSWRGLFSDYTNIVTWPLMLVGLFLILRQRQYHFLMFFVLAAYCFSVHAVFTHNIPRYNKPIGPMLAITSAIVLHRLTQKESQGKGEKKA